MEKKLKEAEEKTEEAVAVCVVRVLCCKYLIGELGEGEGEGTTGAKAVSG